MRTRFLALGISTALLLTSAMWLAGQQARIVDVIQNRREKPAIAVIDFRITNPSNVQFEVRTVTVEMEDNQGKSTVGQSVSEMDAKRLFEALPMLRPKFNPTLLMRERLGSHGSADRMIAARFQAPMATLDGRKRFIVKIEEVDGKSFEYAER